MSRSTVPRRWPRRASKRSRIVSTLGSDLRADLVHDPVAEALEQAHDPLRLVEEPALLGPEEAQQRVVGRLAEASDQRRRCRPPGWTCAWSSTPVSWRSRWSRRYGRSQRVRLELEGVSRLVQRDPDSEVVERHAQRSRPWRGCSPRRTAACPVARSADSSAMSYWPSTRCAEVAEQEADLLRGQETIGQLGRRPDAKPRSPGGAADVRLEVLDQAARTWRCWRAPSRPGRRRRDARRRRAAAAQAGSRAAAPPAHRAVVGNAESASCCFGQRAGRGAQASHGKLFDALPVDEPVVGRLMGALRQVARADRQADRPDRDPDADQAFVAARCRGIRGAGSRAVSSHGPLSCAGHGDRPRRGRSTLSNSRSAIARERLHVAGGELDVCRRSTRRAPAGRGSRAGRPARSPWPTPSR